MHLSFGSNRPGGSFSLFPKFLYRIKLGTQESKHGLLFQMTKVSFEGACNLLGEWSEEALFIICLEATDHFIVGMNMRC